MERKGLACEPSAVAKAGYALPQGEFEEQLAGIWKRILDISEVEREANFFELGAQSLHALELHFEVLGTWGVDVPLQIIFELPVLKDQVAFIRKQWRASARPISGGHEQTSFEDGVV